MKDTYGKLLIITVLEFWAGACALTGMGMDLPDGGASSSGFAAEEESVNNMGFSLFN